MIISARPVATPPLSWRAARETPPEESFPDAWVGSWQGELEVSSGEKLGMELDIARIPGTPRYTWTIRYQGQPARPYELAPVDPKLGHYVVDEKNGIIIDSFYQDGTLFSQFEVGSSRVSTRYELEDGKLTVEMPLFGRHPMREGAHGVRVFPFVNVQRAVLTRVDE